MPFTALKQPWDACDFTDHGKIARGYSNAAASMITAHAVRASRELRGLNEAMDPGEMRTRLLNLYGGAAGALARCAFGAFELGADQQDALACNVAAFAAVVAIDAERAAKTIGQSLRYAEASFARVASKNDGWELLVPGPRCGETCRALFSSGWHQAGELPLPGEVPCGPTCAAGLVCAAKPFCIPPGYETPATFRRWDIDEVESMTPWELRDLEPYEAAEILSQLGDDLDDDVAAILEEVAMEGGYPTIMAVSPGNSDWDPRNPANSDYADTASARQNRLSVLLAGQPAHLDGTEVAHFSATVPNDYLNAAAEMVHTGLLNEASSKRLYANDRGGYERDRARFHMTLAAGLMDDESEAAGKPVAVVAFGGPCTGKTEAVADEVELLTPCFTRIDPGEIVKRLPEYQGWNAPLLTEEAKDIADLAMARAVANRHHVFIVEDDPSRADALLSDLGDAGYDVMLFHVTASPESLAMRAADRFLVNPFGYTRITDPPGHFTNPNTVASKAQACDEAYLDLRDHPKVTAWFSYSTDGAMDSPLQQIDAGTR